MHDAFMDDICENPDDDTPRLVYADWLDDNGHEDRAQFIRLQIAAERLPYGKERWDLCGRANETKHRRWEEWFGWLKLGREGIEVERGFVSGIKADIAWLVERGDWPRLPLRRRELEDRTATEERVQALAGCAGRGRVTRLSLGGEQLDSRHVYNLLWQREWPTLEDFELHGVYMLASLIMVVFHDQPLPALRRLTLRGTGLAPDDTEIIADSPLLPRLDGLDLGGNPLGDLRDFAGTDLSALRSLGLEAVTTDLDNLRALLANPTLAGVRLLDLAGNGLGDETASALPHKALSDLFRLDLGRNDIGPAGITRLATWLARRPLFWLNLGGNPLGDEGLAALLEAGALDKVDCLDLSDCSLGDSSADALCAAAIDPFGPNLRDNAFSAAALSRLRRRFGDRMSADDDPY